MKTNEEKKQLLIDMLNGKVDCFEMKYIKSPGKDWEYVSNQFSENVDEGLPEKLPNQ